MRVIKYDWPRVVSPRKPAVIYVFSDTHFGNPNTNYELLEKHIEMCKRERAGWFHLGDWCEFISPRDRRFSIDNPPPSITEQIDLAVETFDPIKKQGVACLSGNHEEVIEREYGSVMKGRAGIADLLGVPYLGDMGFVSFGVSRTANKTRPDKYYKIFLWHGHGMGRLLGAKTIKLQRLSHKFDAEIYLMGHIHTYLAHTDRLIGIRTHGLSLPIINNTQRKYASAPCYFDAYEESDSPNYATARALYPQPNGCLRVEFAISRPYNAVGNPQWTWKIKIEPLLDEAVLE